MSTIFLPLLARPRNRGWGGDGEMWYQDADGIWQSIQRPPDWASIPYFLGLDQTTGYPAWLALPGVVTYIVRGAFISSTLQLFPPSVSRIVTLPLIGPTAVLYPPLLESIGLPFFSTTQLFAPSITEEQAVTGGTIAAGTQLFEPSIATPLEVTGGTIASTVTLYPPSVLEPEPWMEIARQDTISAGKLVLSGLNLGDYATVRLAIAGIRVTTDDSQVFVRIRSGGAVVSSNVYRWSCRRVQPATSDVLNASSGVDTEIPLSLAATGDKVGNDATESLDAEMTCYAPGGSDHKNVNYDSVWTKPTGVVAGFPLGGAIIETTGAIDGFEVYADSDLVNGTLTLMAVE